MTETVDALRLMPQKLTDVIELATQHNAMCELIGLTLEEQITVMSAELSGESEYLQKVYALKNKSDEEKRNDLFRDYCLKVQAEVAKELLHHPRKGVEALYKSYTAPYTKDDVEQAVAALELIKSAKMDNVRVLSGYKKEENGDTTSLNNIPKINAICEEVTCYLANPATLMNAMKGQESTMRG